MFTAFSRMSIGAELLTLLLGLAAISAAQTQTAGRELSQAAEHLQQLVGQFVT